jgi:hypothetical protein
LVITIKQKEYILDKSCDCDERTLVSRNEIH